MSVRDGKRLGVLDSVSVTVKCFGSHIHGEECRLGYRLAGRHVESYKQHKCSFRNNTHTSNFAQHLIENMHCFVNIRDIMHIQKIHKKGHHLNTLERFHIHIEADYNNHLNGITQYPLTASSILS